MVLTAVFGFPRITCSYSLSVLSGGPKGVPVLDVGAAVATLAHNEARSAENAAQKLTLQVG